ncbi:hypothetical protein ALP97_00527 [Pseudomonas salomonii]|uniref:Uncharacterized protein n=1 Tax=Pseudomonas salomonii TaxID=191391 RepID=A0A3M4QDW5_9PSED|nr:hypothetical protein ALP97_00527 [Pseudomonas salomonii]
MAQSPTRLDPLPIFSLTKTRKPAKAGFLTAHITSTYSRQIKPAPLHHRKYIRHILDHDPRGIGDGINVMLGIDGDSGKVVAQVVRKGTVKPLSNDSQVMKADDVKSVIDGWASDLHQSYLRLKKG